MLLLPYLIQSVIVIITLGLIIVLFLLFAIFARDAAGKVTFGGAQLLKNSEYGNNYGSSSKIEYSDSSSNGDSIAAVVTSAIVVAIVILCICFGEYC